MPTAKRSLQVLAFVLAGAAPVLAQETATPLLGAWGVETQYVDRAIGPGDDFYRFVNNGWLTTATIPDGFSRATAFLDADLRTEAQMTELIADIVASDAAPGSDEALIKAVYQSYRDVATLDALGLDPIRKDVDAILATETSDEIVRWMARPFTTSIADIAVELDSGNPKRYVVALWQGGLGLPAREYYLLPDEPFAAHRTAYRDYIRQTFERAGIAEAASRADAILALETKIAELQWAETEMRDPVRMYNLMPVSKLADFAPGFNWAAFLAEAGYGDQTEVVLQTDTAVQALAKLFAATPVETWRSYLAFHYIDSFADILSSDWQDFHFAFHSTRLSGVEKRRPLEPRAVAMVSALLGEPLGRVYVKHYFPPEYRAQMDMLVGNVVAAFRNRLQENAWMDAETRAEALKKLDAITTHIGYPDRWHNYSGVVLKPGDLVGNVKAISAFQHQDRLTALKGPRRDWEWIFTPQTINAGYSPDRNLIEFPAAILQPPFFDPNADIAVNYGSIGAVIGHELGHAFDDQGSRFDPDGILRNWWTPAAREEFERRAAVLVGQFDTFSPVEGMNVNGALTLGENIGDLGGLTVAYDAYRLAVEQGAEASRDLNDFTGDQRFFMAWAQVWRTLATPDVMRQLILSDPHSPGEFRVNGIVRNVDGWYSAFDVKQGDALYLPPDQRAKVW
ncbi:MAG: M13 family metallopeptidase [Rhizobiaceae bacterium]|nr:M13 family metallopeptidase [Rhizobiaceae bacterium]